MKDNGGSSNLFNISYHGMWTHGISNWTNESNFQPPTNELTVSYADVNTEIVFNDIDVTYERESVPVLGATNEIGNKPTWVSGSFDVTQNAETTTYDKDSGIPFGFFMDAATFRTAIGAVGYTQK